MSEQLVIAGFHRSGTSLAAGLLHHAGLFLGYELLDALPSNPYGHFEDVDVVRLHGGILADNDLTWLVGAPLLPVIRDERWRRMREIVERRNAENALWGFKDPRACLFMMPWKYLMPDMKVLLVYRHFADSTYSLAKRHSSDLFEGKGQEHLHLKLWREPDLALRMWVAHNDALISFARAYPEDTLTVSLEMIQNGFPVVEAVNRRWSPGLEDVPVGEVYDPGVTFKRPGKQPISDSRLIGRVGATWTALQELSRETEQIFLREEAVVPERLPRTRS